MLFSARYYMSSKYWITYDELDAVKIDERL